MTEEQPYLSEEDFLLIELRYTVAQVRFQLDHARQLGGKDLQVRSFYRQAWPLLEELVQGDREELHATVEKDGPLTELVEVIASLREKYMAVLQGQPQPWPEPLLRDVRERLAQDRRIATSLADLWRENESPLHEE